jgi:hypothetical protein
MSPAHFLFWLAGAALTSGALAGQAVPPNGAVHSPTATKTVPLPPVPPPPLPPPPRNPVENLRQLLAKNPAERESALAEKPEKQRDYLRRRLRELDALSPAERELQLRLLQLRFYLLPLMKTAPTNRAEALLLVPSPDRNLIQARLREWDALAPDQQQELLQNEAALSYFPRFGASTQVPPRRPFADLSVQQRQKLEEDLARWQQFPPGRQEQIYRRFQRFFELSDQQQVKALGTLPKSELEQTRKTVEAFAKLPPEQRAKCLEAFHRFASMTPEERNKFLDNAGQWEAMSPEERRAWRELVAQSPPSPPGLGLNLPSPPSPPGLGLNPPLPPSRTSPPGKAVALTNAPRP